MAPKEPPNKPGKDEPTSKELSVKVIQEKLKKFFKSSYSLYVGGLLVFGFFLAASILTALYIKEVKRRAVFHEGIRRILKIVEDSFPKYSHDDDITKIKKAENVSLSIAENKRNIAALKGAIADINHELEHEWVMWRGALYSFETTFRTRTWKECIEYCHNKKYNTRLLCVESDAEQAFAISAVKHKPNDYFVGVFRQDRSWLCYDKRIPVRRQYWDRGQPAKGVAKCVVLGRKCSSYTACWHAINCSIPKRCVCKRKPIAKWMK